MFTSLFTVFILTGTIIFGQTACLFQTDLFTILHSPILRNTLSYLTTVLFTNHVIITCTSNLTPLFSSKEFQLPRIKDLWYARA